ncbi:MAG: hypothetical protein VW870_12110, partial [Rhodobiaceae bacterium]
MGEELAGTATFHDTHARAGQKPAILDTVRGSDQRVGIRRERNRSVDHRFHAAFSKRRNARHRRFDDVLDRIQIRRHQV